MTARALPGSIPERLDSLPGSHWRVVGALGTAWPLDGLEVTVVVDAERKPLEAIARALGAA